MANPFSARRPWAAALVGLIEPFIGMFYLGRGRLGLLYLAITFPVAGFAGALGRSTAALAAIAGAAVLAFHIIGSVHAYRIAARGIEASQLRWFSRWYVLTAILIGPALFAFGVRTFLWQPFDVRSVSMQPTLNIGDYFFVSKYAFNTTGPQRGDLVVFRFSSTSYVKRVVGLPGDRVQMLNGRVFVNGKGVPQTRSGDFVEIVDGNVHKVPRYRETMPDGRSYFVLDRLSNGPSDNTDIYVVPEGHYFVLGDNRDNSMDSRGDMGFVSREDIVGKPEFLWWNSHTKHLMWELLQ